MARVYSLAYLSSHRCTPPEAVRVAAANGYQFVGLRLWPNAPGAPQQFLLDRPEVLKATQAAMADTGVGIFDVEIIRIGETFDPHTWDALYDACAALKAKAILVAGDNDFVGAIQAVKDNGKNVEVALFGKERSSYNLRVVADKVISLNSRFLTGCWKS